jgi:hypothetical protein
LEGKVVVIIKNLSIDDAVIGEEPDFGFDVLRQVINVSKE